MSSFDGFAILAPVPEEHLIDGEEVCAREGRVAFGSRAWERFREVDTGRNGMSVEVLIYESGGLSKPEARWRATYVGHVEGHSGAHPNGMKYRPPSTAKYEMDNKGYWAVFWEVSGLRRVPKGEEVKIRDLRGLGKKSYYSPTFIPEGPLLIEYPF
jgi:hypothetical protein